MYPAFLGLRDPVLPRVDLLQLQVGVVVLELARLDSGLLRDQRVTQSDAISSPALLLEVAHLLVPVVQDLL